MTFRKKKNNGNITRVNKKGIFLTCLIVAGILGASFIVWLIPSDNVRNNGSGNMVLTFSDPNETLASVNSRFALLQVGFQDQINEVKTGGTNLTYTKNLVDTAILQNNELMVTLLNGNPPESLMPNYIELMNSLKNYSIYLSNIKNITLTSTNITNDIEKLK